MDRRSFIKKTGLVAGAALVPSLSGNKAQAKSALAAPYINKGLMQWVLASEYASDTLFGKHIEDFGHFVTQATKGKLTIKVFHSGQLYKRKKSFDAVIKGEAQMGYGKPNWWKKNNPAMTFIVGMPFGLTAAEQDAWLYHAGGIKLIDSIYKPLGVKFLPMGNTGAQMGGWYKRQVVTSSDLRKMKIRMGGLGGKVLRAMGVETVKLSKHKVLPGLLTGKVDAAEWIGPLADLSLGLYKGAQYCYYPGWHEPGSLRDGYINLAAWEALTSTQKEIVKHAAAHVNEHTKAEFRALNNAALRTLVDEHGVKMRKFSTFLLGALGEVAAEVLPVEAGKHPDSLRLYKHIIEFRQSIAEWSSLSEQAMMEARFVARMSMV